MYKLKILFVILISLLLVNCKFERTKTEHVQQLSSREIINTVFKKGMNSTTPDYYAGILMLHGMSEFSLLKGNENVLKETNAVYVKFATGEIEAKGNFISYEAGGSGAAYLVWKNASPETKKHVEVIASKMMTLQNRTPEGLMTAKFATHEVFIDVAFAVTPYLLYSGLAFNNEEYVNYAVFETLELFRILKDKNTGLLHQARGFRGIDHLTDDNWSRGNGWGAFALALLVRDLPESHPKRQEVVELAQQFFTSVIAYQNTDGLWHQEMTDTTSYVETSGSGLLLYGIGIMIEKGLLDRKYLENFSKGLESYAMYIGSDGSVSHTCRGCLCPQNGTKVDYKNRHWVYNDPHAFGPVILAFTQGIKLGIDNITVNKEGNTYNIMDNPDVPRTYLVQAREGKDVAWENDRIAFRLFSSAVRGKAGSGIDVWAKSVAYPVLDKWYAQNEKGQSYHVDHGEGHDFYDMGKLRGCGGLAIWIDGRPYVSETFDSYEIWANRDDLVSVTFNYDSWNIPDMQIREERNIEMGLGTNLFRGKSIIYADTDMELTVAIGLTTFGRSKVYQDSKRGILSVWETIEGDQNYLGTAVLVKPESFVGFASFENDEYVLIKVKANTPFIYYAGAVWSKSEFLKSETDWLKYLKSESKRNLKTD